MKIQRRQFLHLARALPLSRLQAVSRVAWQAYPTRPVPVIVGFPGGAADIVA
jgi:hypothetical protein